MASINWDHIYGVNSNNHGIPLVNKFDLTNYSFRDFAISWLTIQSQQGIDDVAVIQICCDTFTIDSNIIIKNSLIVFARRIVVLNGNSISLNLANGNYPQVQIITQQTVDENNETTNLFIVNINGNDAQQFVSFKAKGKEVGLSWDFSTSSTAQPVPYAPKDLDVGYFWYGTPLQLSLMSIFTLASVIFTEDIQVAIKQLQWVRKIGRNGVDTADMAKQATTFLATLQAMNALPQGAILVPALDESVYAAKATACFIYLNDRNTKYTELQKDLSNLTQWKEDAKTQLKVSDVENDLNKKLETKAQETLDQALYARVVASNQMNIDQLKLPFLQDAFNAGIKEWKTQKDVGDAFQIVSGAFQILQQIPMIIMAPEMELPEAIQVTAAVAQATVTAVNTITQNDFPANHVNSAIANGVGFGKALHDAYKEHQKKKEDSKNANPATTPAADNDENNHAQVRFHDDDDDTLSHSSSGTTQPSHTTLSEEEEEEQESQHSFTIHTGIPSTNGNEEEDEHGSTAPGSGTGNPSGHGSEEEPIKPSAEETKKAAVQASVLQATQGMTDGANQIVSAVMDLYTTTKTAKSLEATGNKVLQLANGVVSNAFSSLTLSGVDTVTGGSENWDNFLNQIDSMNDQIKGYNISGASEYILGVRQLVVDGKAFSQTQLAVAKASTALAEAIMRKQAANKIAEIYNNRFTSLQDDIANDAVIGQLLYTKVIDAKRAVYLALESYQRSVVYFTLQPASAIPMPSMTSSIGDFSSAIANIAGNELVLDSLFPTPQTIGVGDKPGISININDDKIIKELKKDAFTSFEIKTSDNDFNDFHRIRLSTVRIFLVGINATENVEVNIVTNGVYNDKAKDGQPNLFVSKPMKINFVYSGTADTPNINIDGTVPLRYENDFFQPTPFTKWTIHVKNQKTENAIDLKNLTGIQIQLSGEATAN